MEYHYNSTSQYVQELLQDNTCACEVLESCLNTEPKRLPVVTMAVTTTAIKPVSFGEITNIAAIQPNACHSTVPVSQPFLTMTPLRLAV